MKIDVTQEDIDNGEPRSSVNCPIALALGRATGRPWRVMNYRAADVYGTLLALPKEAVEFQRRFDDWDGPVLLPFSFEVEG